MGVLTLWPLLEAARETCDLQSLSGKTLAVDLSCWICQACALHATAGKVNKPHVRTLFFRVAQLYRLDVKLVFVCDGAAVELKYDTIAKRIDARHGRSGSGATAGGAKTKRKCSRTQLNRRVKECVDLLSALGIPTIKANGEAEALCALLNAVGLVDGCITEDSDTFLYGAKVVYRGLSTSPKEMEVSRYTMERVRERVGFTRQHLVALALLLGCDYVPLGVPGVGKETALKLIRSVPGDILERFDSWRHHGGCTPDGPKSVEATVCRKALNVAAFPFPEVTKEYFSPNESPPRAGFKWQRPHIQRSSDLLVQHLEWAAVYAWEKVFPLLTNWHLKVHKSQPDDLHASLILKSCIRSGVPCYEVSWRGVEAQLPESPDQDSSTGGNSSAATRGAGGPEEKESALVPWTTTTERRDLIENAHPSVVHDYAAQQERLKQAKKAGNSRKKREVKQDAQRPDPAEENKENETEAAKTHDQAGMERPSLRQRLKQRAATATAPVHQSAALADPTASTTFGPDGDSDHEEFLEVASVNPFKLHDESMEVLTARGFHCALAGLDESMAAINLQDPVDEEEDVQSASYSADSMGTSVGRLVKQLHTESVHARHGSIDRSQFPQEAYDQRQPMSSRHGGVLGPSASGLKSRAEISCDETSDEARLAPDSCPAYVPLAERVRRWQRQQAQPSNGLDVGIREPGPDKSHHSMPPAAAAAAPTAAAALPPLGVQHTDRLDDPVQPCSQHFVQRTTSEVRRELVSRASTPTTVAAHDGHVLASAFHGMDLGSSDGLPDGRENATSSDPASGGCSDESSLEDPRQRDEATPLRTAREAAGQPPVHSTPAYSAWGQYATGETSGPPSRDGSTVLGDATRLLASLSASTPLSTPARRPQTAMRYSYCADSPMDCMSPATYLCAEIASQEGFAMSPVSLSDSLIMDVDLVSSLACSTPRLPPCSAQRHRPVAKQPQPGTSKHPILID